MWGDWGGGGKKTTTLLLGTYFAFQHLDLSTFFMLFQCKNYWLYFDCSRNVNIYLSKKKSNICSTSTVDCCTCVISCVVISMACSSSLLSSSVGRFICLSWSKASSFIFCRTRVISYWIWKSTLDVKNHVTLYCTKITKDYRIPYRQPLRFQLNGRVCTSQPFTNRSRFFCFD